MVTEGRKIISAARLLWLLPTKQRSKNECLRNQWLGLSVRLIGELWRQPHAPHFFSVTK
jgi:hypothetical protein